MKLSTDRKCFSTPSTLGLVAVALVLGSVAIGCAASDPEETEETNVQNSEAAAHRRRAPACLAQRDVCDPTADACCAGSVCTEYTIYDHPRCLPRRALGERCIVSQQCTSGVCDENFVCATAPACRALDDTCVVGEDTCCEGSCVEYTIYDYPRCRKDR